MFLIMCIRSFLLILLTSGTWDALLHRSENKYFNGFRLFALLQFKSPRAKENFRLARSKEISSICSCQAITLVSAPVMSASLGVYLST